MITIYNKTTNEMVKENFYHMLTMFDYLVSNGYGKCDKLDILADGTKILEINNWGKIKGGIDFYMKKFWGIK
jgi:hypothetical protein